MASLSPMPLRPSEPDIFSPKSTPSSRAMRAGGERGGIGVDSVPHAEEMPAPARGSAATATATKVRGLHRNLRRPRPSGPLPEWTRLPDRMASEQPKNHQDGPCEDRSAPSDTRGPLCQTEKSDTFSTNLRLEEPAPETRPGLHGQCGLCPPALSRDGHCRMPLAWPSRQRQTPFVSVRTAGPRPDSPPGGWASCRSGDVKARGSLRPCRGLACKLRGLPPLRPHRRDPFCGWQ